MRVHVHSSDMRTDLGEGIIEKVEPLCIKAVGIAISSYHSRIVLDSGKVTEGIDCWWIPVTEKEDEGVVGRSGRSSVGYKGRYKAL